MTRWHSMLLMARVCVCLPWLNPAVQGSAESASLLWGEFAYSAHLIICTMCDEEPSILMGNSTDAFPKWRSGEQTPLPTLLRSFTFFSPLLFLALSVSLFEPSPTPLSQLTLFFPFHPPLASLPPLPPPPAFSLP